MSNLQNAFDTMLGLIGRSMTLERMGQYTPITIKVGMSNYFRNFSAPAEVVIEGRELIISYTDVKGTDYDPPKRGDRLDDSYIGENTIREVKELFGLGGEILGFRVRID